MFGVMAIVITWPPPLAPELPSSNVRKTTELAKAELFVIDGRKAFRKLSPSAMDPSCMSLIRFGVMNSKFAAAGSKLARFVMLAHAAPLPLMLVWVMAGAGLRGSGEHTL